ncbi:uncharacterized protein B0I36DRAFT_331170 [Microdochium trichocladiopsis]|uniref:Sialidase n=1 Tax=Microdochium trichocladiopsis TaxID=1682393 RepID=A0A9P8Y0T9_9PEZI|nr:uncharacterized protein B0I36DRAFT_331170 [Microdochium trichocladiopsis]KAH7026704.1 hypothetical protein B0I36DRAFT_331170 [Microdochium trichocladiopsis]
MASLTADMSAFDFVFPSCEPSTPPSFSFDPSYFEMPVHGYDSNTAIDFHSNSSNNNNMMMMSMMVNHNTNNTASSRGHSRSGSHASFCSSTLESSPSDSPSTRASTPATRCSTPPVRHHGPVLLPKIRSQDQSLDQSPPKRARTSPASVQKPRRRQPAFRPSHARSYTNPETINNYAAGAFFTAPQDASLSQSLLCSPVVFAQDSSLNDFQTSRRASTISLDGAALDKFGFPTYRQMPSYVASAMSHPQMDQFSFNFAHRAPSPLSMPSVTPEPAASTTLMDFLTTPNPTPTLVRSLSYSPRDPNTKHFWWDVRQVRPWSSFKLDTILSLPGASALLNCPVPEPLLPQPAAGTRHPETESALHNIYASYYVPKLNSALAVSSQRAMQFSSTSSKSGNASEQVFVANIPGEASTAAAIFGGKPTARVVGIAKSFDRFNTGMRVEGNIKRVEYLRGLAHIHHVMREHGTRYGFILTEIELVIVRNGAEKTPHFGYLEVASVQLTAAQGDEEEAPLTACLALWGLCRMAGDEPSAAEHIHWKAEIGAPAEGTRRKALPRDDWMPQPQLAEKREAKRARGWVMPEDAVGRKELGKRGVRYGAC